MDLRKLVEHRPLLELFGVFSGPGTHYVYPSPARGTDYSEVGRSKAGLPPIRRLGTLRGHKEEYDYSQTPLHRRANPWYNMIVVFSSVMHEALPPPVLQRALMPDFSRRLAVFSLGRPRR